MSKILVILIISVLISVGAGILIGRSDLISSKSNYPTPTISPNPTPVSPTPSEQLEISGTIKKIPFPTQILNPNKQGLDEIKKSSNAYEAGTFITGEYSGYKRYIVLIQDGPINQAQILISKDGQNFILDDTNLTKSQLPGENEYSFFSKKAVSKSAPIPRFVSSSLKMNNFDYAGIGIQPKYIKSGDSYDFVLLQVSNLRHIGTSIANEEIYYFPKSLEDYGLQSETDVYIADSTGLVYDYAMATEKNYETYDQKRREFNTKKNLDDTNTWLDKVDLNVYFPSGKAGTGFYKEYRNSFPKACSTGLQTWVFNNLTDSDFKEGPIIDGVHYLILKDQNHPLNKLAYQVKISANKDSWNYTNPTKIYPTFEEYVSKNPLLFFKDPFGRFVSVGEYDYLLPGGCGKPVIYLYPEKPAKINLSFETKVNFATQIPPYKSGWLIEAKPDGTLTDLNWQVKDCANLDGHFGSEYAPAACKNNAYPYLYWSGTVLGQNLPDQKTGWIISKKEADTFFDSKLKALGLTPKESQDFKDYWVKKITNSNSELFKISFLVDGQVSQIFPMHISPMPDSVRRIFVQITPVQTSEPLTPQALPSFQRHGFTMVEWGATNF